MYSTRFPVMPPSDEITRCSWCGTDPLYVAYHDHEWGRPVHDDQHLFEMLTLEGAQAGLSWITVLRKREGYRDAFCHFDIEAVAAMTPGDEERLRGFEGIVRNRLKISSTVSNAKAFLKLQEEMGSFSEWYWAHTDGQVIQNQPQSLGDLPASTALSEQISKELKRLGFRFVGPTIIYAFMQATGMVNDHVLSCFVRQEMPKTT
jgi:DNA-3-methyladenine glycosylase I